MLKLALLLLIAVSSAQGIICPITPISPADLAGYWPPMVTNITLIPKGTNCTIQFNIPNNYVLLLKFSADFQSADDKVTIFDNKAQPKYNLVHTGKVFYDVPLWMPALSAQVQVVGVSGNTRFLLSYMFQSLNGYQKVNKNTGDYFPLSSITGNNYYTITASVNEKVVVNYAQRAGAAVDVLLSEYYVYDGDNINTATMIGSLADIGSKITVSAGRSISIVNFFGTKSNSYVLGNDASTVSGFTKYTVIMTSLGSTMSGNMTDLTNNGAAYTFICTDCSTFYWTKNDFDSLATIANLGNISFQGQTPTHKKEKLVRYDAMTFTSNYLPQLLTTNIFTINLYMSRIGFNVNTINNPAPWNTVVDGRKGYIFSPNLWAPTVNNNFNYNFRDDSQLYNFTLNMNKMSFPASSDQMTLKIGATSGTPAVNNVYPRDQSSNGKVMSNGNYMQVGLTASVGADVRLQFEMRKVSSASVAGIMASIILTIFYSL